MPYLISFLEGFITFISPCMLPMLPVYISFFAGGADTHNKSKNALINSVAFVLGFSVVFVMLGAVSGSLGTVAFKNSKIFNITGGSLMILFGLNYIGILKIGLFNKIAKLSFSGNAGGFLSSLLFGIVFSVGWSPCVGTFLGSALMLAANQGTALKGVILLIIYSLGLGIPFVASAVLIEQLKTVFAFIKKHYGVINIISGLLLITMGVFMLTGYLARFLSLLSF